MGDGNQLWHAAVAIGIGTLAATYILMTCVITEYVAPIERPTLRCRLPGTLMQITGSAFGALIILPAQWAWGQLGIEPYLVPLWSVLGPLGALGMVLQVLAILLITDFLRYWRHRAEHKWLWSIHAVHHAPQDLHAANSLGHPLQTIPEILIVTIPLSLIEFNGPAIPVAVTFLSSFLTFYIHSPTQIHFGSLRAIVVDNRFHRIHHSMEERHFDKNFGICFSLWDWMFGTAHWPAPDEWAKVGVQGISPPGTVADFLLFPLCLLIGKRDEDIIATEAGAGMGHDERGLPLGRRHADRHA